MWTIAHDRLRYWKVCAQWVPKQLTDQLKELRMSLALQHLFQYHEQPHFPGEDRYRRNINADVHRETLRNLLRFIKNKRSGLITEGVVLLYNNVRPYIFWVIHAELAKFKREQLDHPPYSLDISPCDFQVFGSQKKYLQGKRFNSEDEFMDCVKDWVSSRPQEF
ncbi:DDE_3 domain-containing protein [Trichonephila inaurata madagascariensis]|uniref:DDE_3 domain-containing protein n=1 Tax=Trichonephila inaurata madagascariensis TaxID=2747483 RepID=A0A8X6WXI5_9ARAC|nr:DDE_3 domain-containing protein [Trichonephila inaurata madagascariensis]